MALPLLSGCCWRLEPDCLATCCDGFKCLSSIWPTERKPSSACWLVTRLCRRHCCRHPEPLYAGVAVATSTSLYRASRCHRILSSSCSSVMFLDVDMPITKDGVRLWCVSSWLCFFFFFRGWLYHIFCVIFPQFIPSTIIVIIIICYQLLPVFPLPTILYLLTFCSSFNVCLPLLTKGNWWTTFLLVSQE